MNTLIVKHFARYWALWLSGIGLMVVLWQVWLGWQALEIQVQSGDTYGIIRVDKTITMPFFADCAWLEWSIEGVKSLTLNQDGKIGQWSQWLCGESATLTLTKPDDTTMRWVLVEYREARALLLLVALTIFAACVFDVLRPASHPLRVWLIRHTPERDARQLLEGAIIVALVVAFAVAYVIPSLYRTYIYQTSRSLPAMELVSFDLHRMLDNAELYRAGESPYPADDIEANPYSPFVTLLISVLPTDWRLSARIVALLTLASLVYVLFGFTRQWQTAERWHSLSVFTLMAMFSFGVIFELERGQFNVIALALALGGVALAWRGGFSYWLAIPMLVVATQLKLYPLIFAFFLLRWGRAWWQSLVALGLFAFLNVVAFFALGTHTFDQFWQALSYQSNTPYVWLSNHSFYSYAQLMREGSIAWGYAAWELWGFLGGVVLLVGVSYGMGNRNPLSKALLLVFFTLATLFVPAASHDYKLSLFSLAAVIALRSMVMNKQTIASLGLQVTQTWVFGLMGLSAILVAFPPDFRPVSFQHALLPMILFGAGYVWWYALQQRAEWLRWSLLMLSSWMLVRGLIILWLLEP